MTTPKAGTQPAAQIWEPFPELPREPKDMQQIRPIKYLQDMFLSILTPGFSYQDHPTILIGGEIPIYYAPAAPGSGGPPPHVIPDCLIAFDVDTDAVWRRVGYDPLQNGKPPDFVIEVASRRTHRNDTMRKRDIYQRIGVPEYWRFDPEGGRYYGQVIIGERLVNGQYERFPLTEYNDGSVGATSSVLNLNFRSRDNRFRVHDPETGEEYEHPQQTNLRLGETNARLGETNARLEEANARLEAEIRRLRGEG